MVTQTEVKIVPATREHVPFVAWVMMAAGRSHLPVGLFDFLAGGDEANVLRYCETLATTEQPHFAHYTTFLVAEVNGVPAAGMCGYFEAEHGNVVQGILEANETLHRTPEEFAPCAAKAGTILLVSIGHGDVRPWIVENVATKPEFRRQGLVERLMAAHLDRGRERGASTADIGVFINNDAAQRAYEKCGFAVIDEKRHPAFEAAYGTPGVRALRRSI
jgi:ribosomal protein S18 acetylase RimI-like enzyme